VKRGTGVVPLFGEEMTMASQRIEIDPETVSGALAKARDGISGILDYVDTQQPYLVLRVRGHAITWLVKTRRVTRKIGSPPGMLVREARRQAPIVFAQVRDAVQELPSPASSAPAGWTWDNLRIQYLEHIKSPRIRRGRARQPSRATAVDVALSLRRKAFDAWREREINTLQPGDLIAAVISIQKGHSQRQCEKALSYVKAALTWALSNHASDSGLHLTSPWWMLVRAPQSTTEQVEKVLALQKVRHETFTVEHLGLVLARHEDFCRGKSGNEKISPGVRWGLWWDALTGNRRGAATMLLRDAILPNDPRGQVGWGLVWWPAEIMKTRIDFWLPVPPLGLHILNGVRRDWRALVNKSHGFQNETKWVFASTRRIGRTDTNTDVVVAPDAISNHLSNLRGRRQHNHRNLLDDVPYFSLHTIRDAAASYLLDRDDIPPGAASAMLAHKIKGDHDPRHEKMSPTTHQFYDFAQRLPLKAKAMGAWSEALLAAFEKA
jgi:integrase